MKAIHNKLPINICKICHKKIVGNNKFDQHLQYVHGTSHWDITLAGRENKRQL